MARTLRGDDGTWLGDFDDQPLASWTGNDPPVAAWPDTFTVDHPVIGRMIDLHAVLSWAIGNL